MCVLPPDDSQLVPWKGKICLHCKALLSGDIQSKPTVLKKLLPFITGQTVKLRLQLTGEITSTDDVSQVLYLLCPTHEGLLACLGGWCVGARHLHEKDGLPKVRLCAINVHKLNYVAS